METRHSSQKRRPWSQFLIAGVWLMMLGSHLPAAEGYDTGVPSPESVLGYAAGERVTDYGGMERYLARLAEASPRVSYGSYGSDYEGRVLRYVVVSSAANMERLDSIRSANARLTDPRGLARGEVESLIETTPLVAFLNYCVDGNETAGLESALHMAYHLAASTSSKTESLLEKVVAVLTPVANPSSHERWASWSNSFAAGPTGNADPLAMEHNPPWGVLTNDNHYLVDLNRESIWATQRESAALRELFYEWNPVVFVDHHGEYDNFTGPGYQEPLNPLFTAAQRRWLDRLGKAIGRRFENRGWSYSPWETGSFYPGFWESIGSINGSVSFTYETIGGGRKGLRYRRQDGSIITLKLAAEQHSQASLAVLEAAAAGRQELLKDFAGFWRSALELERTAQEKLFLIDPADDPPRARRLVDVLLANRVEVYRTSSELELDDVHDYLGGEWRQRSFPAGTYVVPVGQPRARLALTMLRKDFSLPEQTLEDAQVFRRNREKAGFRVRGISSTSSLFYDVTAWSMPLTYGVSAFWAEAPLDAGLPGERLVRGEKEDGQRLAPGSEGQYGYVFSGQTNRSMALLAHLLQRGIVLNVAYRGFAVEGRAFPRGSVIVRKERNPGVDLNGVLGRAAERFGTRVHPLGATLADQGPSMGSGSFVFVQRPRVAVLAGDPVSTRSFGNLWFVLERLYELEFTAITTDRLDLEALDGFDVLVLPDGRYGGETFSPDWVAGLKAWVSRGGSLVCLEGAARWASDPERNLASARLRSPRWPPEDAEGAVSRQTVAIPGAILKTTADEHHFLTLGYEGSVPVLVRSNLAFEPDARLATPVSFVAREGLRLSGFAYSDSLDRLANTPYLVDERVGSGHVILFLDDPNFRVYWHGLTRLFLNSILLSPSF